MRKTGRATRIVTSGASPLLSGLLLFSLVPHTATSQSTSTDAAKIPAHVRIGFDAIRESDLRADLAFIASDGLAGRMSLQPGDDAAAAWVASEFAKAGLSPAATDAAGKPSFLQPIQLAEYRADRAAGTVTLDRARKQTTWKVPKAFGDYRDNVDITAPVIFAGFGITSPELGYDDYTGIDARGKIV